MCVCVIDMSAAPCRLEECKASLHARVGRLEAELDQEQKRFRMLEIKLRNSERAQKDADKRNHMLQTEMEEFFSTLGDLTQPGKI